jgi:hypothetical protein
MAVLEVDHPDIEDFKETKVKGEEKIHLPRDAWLRHAPGNNPVRMNDEFMKLVSWGFLRRDSRRTTRSTHLRGQRRNKEE